MSKVKAFTKCSQDDASNIDIRLLPCHLWSLIKYSWRGLFSLFLFNICYYTTFKGIKGSLIKSIRGTKESELAVPPGIVCQQTWVWRATVLPLVMYVTASFSNFIPDSFMNINKNYPFDMYVWSCIWPAGLSLILEDATFMSNIVILFNWYLGPWILM